MQGLLAVSIEALTYAKSVRVYKPARAVWLVIAENTFNDSCVCRVGQQVLADESDTPERTLRTHLARLQRDGHIRRTPKYGVGGGRRHDDIEIVGFREWLADHRLDAAARAAGSKPAKAAGIKPATRLPLHTGNLLPVSVEDSRTRLRTGERGREGGFEQVLQELRTAHPQHRAAVDRLIEPLLRQRKLFGCPDPVYALGELVKAAVPLDSDVLDDTVERVKEARTFSFKVSDLDAALKAAVAARRTPVLEPISPATARLHEALRARVSAGIFDGWFSGVQVESADAAAVVVSVAEQFLKSYIGRTFDGELRDSAYAAFGASTVTVTVRQPREVSV